MSDLVRFGSLVLHIDTADLRGNGRSIRLPEQQFQILQLLLHRGGSVVSREEIRRKLWPNDTIVEYERSINAAILKLRAALREASGIEECIETVPRRGYRLQIPVEGSGLEPAEPASNPASASLIGRKISHYRVLGVLGGGGMGVVYKGEDLRLNRPVALKIVAQEVASVPSTLERLEREARTTSSLNHPNICTIYEIGEHEGQPFIVMEYLEGETLREWISRFYSARNRDKTPLPLRQMLGFAIQMADGLSAAHAQGIIHRDIKPANVFVTSTGIIKLLDFGLAKQTGNLPSAGSDAGEKSAPGETSGTADYMSPEQIQGGSLDQRSDLFSFGTTLAELFTGTHPFHQREHGNGTRQPEQRDVLRLSGDLPQALIVLIRRLLAKSLELRYQSVNELRQDLERIARNTLDVQQPPAVEAIPLIGRDHEFAELKRMLAEAIAGRGSMVMVGGEPGIGKSYLARSILEEARRQGALGVIGHCYEMEGAPAYIPFIEMLEYIMHMAPREGLRYSLADDAPEVARLMPELRNIYPDIPAPLQLPPEQQRRFLFNAFRSFVERAASVTPLVVVFEDLQWADEPTLHLLQHHAQTLSTIPMMAICTYRDVELGVTPPFARTLETLLRQHLAERLHLRRLPQAAVKEMLAALGGQAPPTLLVRAIFEETEGNPFFVEEVFRHLSEEGKLFDENGKWLQNLQVSDVQVPESVRLVLGRRLDHLGKDTRRVLTTAAVIGRVFSLRLLEELENERLDAALDAVEEAEQAHLLLLEPAGRNPRYRFVHELVRQTLAESLSFPRRQRLHLRIAEAIEKVYADRLNLQASQLAHHLYQAGATADTEKATQYLLLAARQARAGSAHEEALEHLDRALSLWEDHPGVRVGELLEQKASALRSLGRQDEAVAAYARAIELFEVAGAFEKAAEASIALSYLQAWLHDADAASRTMERAYAGIAGKDSHLVSSVLAMRAAIMSAAGEPATAESIFNEAKTLGQPPVTQSAEPARMLETIHYYQSFQIEKVHQTCPGITAAYLAEGDAWNASSLEFYSIWADFYSGRPEAAAAALDSAMMRAEKIGHYGAVWALKIAASLVSAARGKLTLSNEQTIEAWEFGAAHEVGWNFATSLQRGHFELWSGDLKAAETWYSDGLKLKGKSYLSGLAEACLFAAWAEGKDPRAAEAWESRNWQLPVQGQINSLGTWCALERSIIGLFHLGCRQEVAALLPLAEELLRTGAWTYALLFPFETIAGIAAECADDWERAEEHHRKAILQTDSAPYHHLRPVAREWYARMLLHRGAPSDTASAKALLGESIALYESSRFPARSTRARETAAEL